MLKGMTRVVQKTCQYFVLFLFSCNKNSLVVFVLLLQYGHAFVSSWLMSLLCIFFVFWGAMLLPSVLETDNNKQLDVHFADVITSSVGFSVTPRKLIFWQTIVNSTTWSEIFRFHVTWHGKQYRLLNIQISCRSRHPTSLQRKTLRSYFNLLKSSGNITYHLQ